jgi:hypothetical protein
MAESGLDPIGVGSAISCRKSNPEIVLVMPDTGHLTCIKAARHALSQYRRS